MEIVCDDTFKKILDAYISFAKALGECITDKTELQYDNLIYI